MFAPQSAGLILMQLCFGFLFGCLSIWGYGTVHYYSEGPGGIRHFGRIGTHSRLLLVLAISSYGIWFWSTGIKDGLSVVTNDDGSPKPCQCYPLYTFFFDKLLVLGGIQYLYIVSPVMRLSICSSQADIHLQTGHHEHDHTLLRVHGCSRSRRANLPHLPCHKT
jgi:hypothetical protein